MRGSALRLCAAWLVLSALGYWQGAAFLRLCAPLISATVRLIAPQLTSHVEIVTDQAQAEVLLDARVARPLRLDAQHVIPTGQPLPSRANAIHALVPLVIFFCVAFAAPARDRRERALSLVLAFPIALTVLVLTTPFQLVGLIEMAIQQHADSRGIVRPEPLSLTWMIFLEGGGRWLLPVAAALLNVSLAARLWHR
jgi:hypothetical protein